MAANKPITLEFLAEVSQFLRETKKVDVSMEDLSDALVATSNSSTDLERKLGRAMREAEKDTESLERAIRDVGDATQDAARESSRGFDNLADDAGDAAREVGDEFKSNLSEALSSGSMEDLVSGTLGGLVGGLSGAVGFAAAGVAGAAALVFHQVKKSWEETQAAIQTQAESLWANALASVEDAVGKTAIQISNTYLAQKELNRLWSEAPDDMVKLVDAAEALNINANDVVLARAGDEAALRRVKAAMDDVYEVQNSTGEATVEQLQGVQDIESALYRAEGAAKVLNAQVGAHNASLPQMAEFYRIMGQETKDAAANSALWAENAEKIKEAFRTMPNDLDVRLRVNADELRQYFPYGVTSGEGYVYDAATWKNPYGTSQRAGE